MPETDAQNPPEPAEPKAAEPANTRTVRRGRSVLSGVLRQVGHVGRDVLSVTLGRWLEEPEDTVESPLTPPPGAPPADQLTKRVTLLHDVAEKLRGAADSYIAAKLDELEARVDEKLDHIERRIDDKMVQLHAQLAEMRDRELRHRLRLLKITLIFAVLVALLSLGYKWLSKYWI